VRIVGGVPRAVNAWARILSGTPPELASVKALGAAARGQLRQASTIHALRPGAHEAQVERGLKVTVEVVRGNAVFQRDDHRVVTAAGLSGAEQGNSRTRGDVGSVPSLLPAISQHAAFFNTQGRYRNQEVARGGKTDRDAIRRRVRWRAGWHDLAGRSDAVRAGWSAAVQVGWPGPTRTDPRRSWRWDRHGRHLHHDGRMAANPCGAESPDHRSAAALAGQDEGPRLGSPAVMRQRPASCPSLRQPRSSLPRGVPAPVSDC